jgi:rhodanese-related sulfurtransferase
MLTAEDVGSLTCERRSEMNTISREELKDKLERGDDFKLVMTLGELAYLGKHIPGSLNLYDKDELLKGLDPEDEIVVYCSDEMCPASTMAYHFLHGQGYRNVKRFSGGLAEWEDAGFPLEGELVA